MKQTVLPLLLIAGLTLTGAACTAEKADAPPSTPKSEALKPQTVETAVVVLRDLSPVVETTGTQEYVLEREGFLKRLGSAYGEQAQADVSAALTLA